MTTGNNNAAATESTSLRNHEFLIGKVSKPFIKGDKLLGAVLSFDGHSETALLHIRQMCGEKPAERLAELGVGDPSSGSHHDSAGRLWAPSGLGYGKGSGTFLPGRHVRGGQRKVPKHGRHRPWCHGFRNFYRNTRRSSQGASWASSLEQSSIRWQGEVREFRGLQAWRPRCLRHGGSSNR